MFLCVLIFSLLLSNCKFGIFLFVQAPCWISCHGEYHDTGIGCNMGYGFGGLGKLIYFLPLLACFL